MAETAKGGPFQEILDGGLLFYERRDPYQLTMPSRHLCQLHLPLSAHSQVYHL